MATMLEKPSTPKALALKTSAMPPTLMRSSSWYLPKGMGKLIGTLRVGKGLGMLETRHFLHTTSVARIRAGQKAGRQNMLGA